MPSAPHDPSPDRLGLTPRRALAVAGLLGLVVGWLAVVVPTGLGFNPPQPPWSAPAALAFAAIVVGVLARSTRQRVQVRRERIDPQYAVSLLVLGKASALAGAAVAGGYLVFGLMFIGRFDADTPRERVIRSGFAVLAGVALCLTGLLLERACKVPDEDDDEPGDGGRGSAGGRGHPGRGRSGDADRVAGRPVLGSTTFGSTPRVPVPVAEPERNRFVG